MKCHNCPACVRTSYEYGDYECAAGVPEMSMVDFADGSGGCRYSSDRIRKRMDRISSEQDKQYDGIEEFYMTEHELENAMREAFKAACSRCGYPDLMPVLAVKMKDGSVRELPEDEWADPSWAFPYWLLSEYQEQEEKYMDKCCKDCVNRGRPHKCACCSRNRRPGRDYYRRDGSASAAPDQATESRRFV